MPPAGLALPEDPHDGGAVLRGHAAAAAGGPPSAPGTPPLVPGHSSAPGKGPGRRVQVDFLNLNRSNYPLDWITAGDHGQVLRRDQGSGLKRVQTLRTQSDPV